MKITTQQPEEEPIVTIEAVDAGCDVDIRANGVLVAFFTPVNGKISLHLCGYARKDLFNVDKQGYIEVVR